MQTESKEKPFRLYLNGLFLGLIWFHVDEIDTWLIKRTDSLSVGALNHEAIYIPVTGPTYESH
jgi:hypothetical protein